MLRRRLRATAGSWWRNISIRSTGGSVLVISGGICTGKTYVSSVFKKLGFHIIAADEIVDEIYKDQHIASHIIHALSRKLNINLETDLLSHDGTLNKANLAEILFHKFTEYTFEEKVSVIEDIVFPLVHAKQQALVRHFAHHGGRSVIIESPLFVESGNTLRYNAVIMLFSSIAVRKRRALSRKYMTSEKFLAIVARQLCHTERLAQTGLVVQNDGNRHFVVHLIRQIVRKNDYVKGSSTRYGNEWVRAARWTPHYRDRMRRIGGSQEDR